MQPTQSPLLARLARVNPTAVFLATLALVLVALFTPGPAGGLLLLLLAGLLGWLMTVTWAVQRPATRVLRLVMLTLLIAVALAKVL
ncbi:MULTISPECIES: DUF6703 family protein [Micromonospora]|uniref:Uncharacterized protein n=1 Tax=Micromonospora solifontis TaxID=2487138 RepID=A0ABX9W8N9_9ACTN|nr:MULTISPECIES: DUF6703 family protein [Micromonospora]NES17018.1 hypothetical protein [Micromonospora sp. PPF5-17B]NES39604.1 hypothetical protein [Micromonospora solifontis]NES58765.1 hypothetical protein [Micromonospora sp. PPF5-6]RNL87948.1 hypothetical protein EFE23_26345 [Micromonospora solifontis]